MNFTDEQLQQALQNARARQDTEAVKLIEDELKSRAPTDWKDVAMSGATGYSKTLMNLMGGAAAAKIGMKPRQGQSLVEKMPWHKPETRSGEYAERVGAGASFGPGGVSAAVAGGAGGALSKFADEQGYSGPYEQIAAWMLPSFLLSGYKALTRTSAPGKDADRVLRETSPMDIGETRANVADAARRGVRLPIWQAAPENSPLHRMGQGIAHNPNADEIQKALMEQAGPAHDKAWVASQAGPAYKSIAGVPVDPTILGKARENTLNVARDMWLDPQTKDAAFLQSTARRLSNPPQYGTPPVSPRREVSFPYAEAQQPYPPTVRSVGNVLSLRDEIKTPPIGADTINAQEKVRLGAVKAVDDAMSVIPGYTEAQKGWSSSKKIAEIMARDQKLRGANVNPLMQLEAKTAPASLAMVGMGTNPWWAMIPYVRDKLGAQAARKLDQALASSDFQALWELAADHPQRAAAIEMIAQGLRSQTQTPPLNVEELMRKYSPIPLPGGGK